MEGSAPALLRAPVRAGWLYELASGYLLGYPRPHRRERHSLSGYSFEHPLGTRGRAGFFVGFLLGSSPPRRSEWAWLEPDPPECLVFAFVRPLDSPEHYKWVEAPGSRFRRAYELLLKYTARRPRFTFHVQHLPAIVRHLPVAAFPPRQQEKYARNFFMETLALLVRSGLPEKLAEAGGTRSPRVEPSPDHGG